jgi:hypothetical protein
MFRRVVMAGLAVFALACSSPTEPAEVAEFIVDVSGERFVLRLTDPDTIQAAEDNRLGRNSQFPIGPLRAGHGGFNAPWTWHFDPAETRFADLAMEVCDGRPSYVETHKPDYPSYCPWGARVIARR